MKYAQVATLRHLNDTHSDEVSVAAQKLEFMWRLKTAKTTSDCH